jgi:hypothetical protein
MNSKEVIFISDMPQVTFLKSIDLRYQVNGPLALKKLKDRYSNESKMKDNNPNTRKEKKKITKEKEKDKESISRATLQLFAFVIKKFLIA